ncbi:MAG: dTMP kinase [Candidatus Bathyarchaeia archaeon]|nr:dTMP kinase [Candidatus Bathyarchaeota archaeon]
MEKGKLICIEGLDKSGKTTQSHLLVEALRSLGFDAVYTTEPSGGEIGRFIERYVLRRRRRISASIEALLFAADRIDHFEREIKPMLEKGKIVVSDRYVYSSFAYQGAAGLDIEWIKEVNRMVPAPDLAIYIDVPLEVVIERCRGKRRSVMEFPDIQAKVQEIYMHLVREGKLIPVNGNRPINEVSKDIRRIVFERLGI